MNKTTNIAVLLGAAFLMTGCNLSQPDVIYVTATPAVDTLVAAPSAAPATQAPPTAVPTPTVPASTLLQVGHRAVINGFYEEALQTYRAVLDGGDAVPADQRAEALFRAGQAALREGLFTDAVDVLTTLIDTLPEHPRVPQAYFLRGDAYLGLSAWDAALLDFQQYLSLRPGLIDSYAYERIADAQLALGQQEAALQSYALASSARRTVVPQAALREKVARVYGAVGRYEESLAQYDAILAIAQNAPYRASIELLAAGVLRDSGDLPGAFARYLTVFDQYPTTPSAYEAMQILLEADVPLDDYAQGLVAYNFGDYQTAIDAFNRFATRNPLTEIPAEMHLLLGRAYREIGNPAAATVAFQTIIEQFPTDPLFGDALLEQGRTQFLAGNIPEAIAEYQRIATTYGYLTDTAAEALWRVGFLQGTNEQPLEARATFEQLASAYPNTEQARSGLFIGASAAYSAGDVAGAERLYARLATTATGEDQAAAYLWVGQLAAQRGDTATASNAYQLAVSAAPDSYFSARARDIVQGIVPFESPSQFVFAFDDEAQVVQAEAWLRTQFGITQDGALWPLSAALDTDTRMVRGRELWAVAAYDEAETEFFDVINERRDAGDALASYQLAVYLRSIGAYYPSIFAAANVIQLAGETTLGAPPYIARMRYPVYYLDVVQDVATQRSIDPLLMFSLIRHESLFDANATAAAGEKGLTQVIPSTGEYIAQQLQWPNYQHSVLFRPYASVAFGAFYLDEQLERFDGNAIAALAGYNAGPGRAANWLALSGGDPDLFMTTITIESTRLYIQRIYSYYNIYRALYGA